jgi:hypothetical protein
MDLDGQFGIRSSFRWCRPPVVVGSPTKQLVDEVSSAAASR